MTDPLISAFIICQNEERQILRCLKSIAWCDEIIVVDSGSTDNTLQICRDFAASFPKDVKITYQAWSGYVAQKRFALSLCTGRWVLNLDADEEVSPLLAREIQALIRSDANIRLSYNGFYLNRVIFFLNRWWRKGAWYPEYRLRLCRREATTWGGRDPHEKASVTGKTSRCKGELYHYSFTDLSDYIRRVTTLALTAANTMHERGERSSLFKLLGRPLARFFKFFVVKRGFREGRAGLMVALIESFSVLVKYAKLWELDVDKG
jgi:glycosyltransferase involved in cell wall biosynthesis